MGGLATSSPQWSVSPATPTRRWSCRSRRGCFVSSRALDKRARSQSTPLRHRPVTSLPVRATSLAQACRGSDVPSGPDVSSDPRAESPWPGRWTVGPQPRRVRPDASLFRSRPPVLVSSERSKVENPGAEAHGLTRLQASCEVGKELVLDLPRGRVRERDTSSLRRAVAPHGGHDARVDEVIA